MLYEVITADEYWRHLTAGMDAIRQRPADRRGQGRLRAASADELAAIARGG